MTDFIGWIAASPVLDIWHFDDPATLRCPDCETASPALSNLWQAVQWADTHMRECQA